MSRRSLAVRTAPMTSLVIRCVHVTLHRSIYTKCLCYLVIPGDVLQTRATAATSRGQRLFQLSDRIARRREERRRATSPPSSADSGRRSPMMVRPKPSRVQDPSAVSDFSWLALHNYTVRVRLRLPIETLATLQCVLFSSSTY